jgi:protein gp37
MRRPSGNDAWWDYSWNPVGGCRAISPGCTNCYAAQIAGTKTFKWLHQGVTIRHGTHRIFNGKLTTAPPWHRTWAEPVRKESIQPSKLGSGMPGLVFIGDMSDVFHKDRPAAVIDRVCATIAASNHIGLLLTKRTARMAAYFAALPSDEVRRWQERLWLGFSAERQTEFDQRWANIRPLTAVGWFIFVSVAPMIGPVVLPPDFLALGGAQAWVIVAGEQGPHADCRDMHPNWARKIRDQCRAANILFFLKQMLHGKPIPPDLQIRQFPKLKTSP